MTTLNISLPEAMTAFVAVRMAQEGFATARAHLRSLIRTDQVRHAPQALEAKLREAIESDPAMPMTGEDWEALRREALARFNEPEVI